MLLLKALLFALAAGHTGFVTILLIYAVITLLKVKYGDVNAQHGCAVLNALFAFIVIIHGSSAFVLALHGHWLLFALDFIVIHMRVHTIVRDQKEGVYDARTIFNGGRIDRHLRKVYSQFLYFSLCLCIYIPRIFEGLNSPIDWNTFDLLKALLFLHTMLLAEAALCVQAYFIIAPSDLELGNLCARDLCQNLNELIIAKAMSHAVLAFNLIAQCSWTFFVSNLQALRWNLRLIADARVSNSDVHIPEKMILPGEIRQHKRYHKACFLYFCVSFVIYLYRTFVGNIEGMAYIMLSFLPAVLLKILEPSNVEGIASILRLLNSRNCTERVLTWAYIVIYLFQWSVAVAYWKYLFKCLKPWSVEEDGDWVLNILVDVTTYRG